MPFDRLLDPEAIANWPKTLGRDGARTPFPWSAVADQAGFSSVEPWLPVDDVQRMLAVDSQHGDEASFLAFTRSCLSIRKAEAALRLGGLSIRTSGEAVLVFERIVNDRVIVCAFNLSADVVEVDALNRDTAILLESAPGVAAAMGQGCFVGYGAVWYME